MSWWGFRPYVSAAERRAKAARAVARLAKKGQTLSPVKIEGRTIASTFWGKAWCDNLEAYSDFANRLPRGRTYVRNGSVVDLQIAPGLVTALVSGSELYKVKIEIKPLAKPAWSAIRKECAGQIGSMIELLQGKLSKSVMEIITRRPGGMFPAPREITMSCSCPDWAGMCKHVAATMYGVGARLDEQPELLFTLRKADHLELIAQAGDVGAITKRSSGQKTIAGSELSDVFGIEIEAAAEPAAAPVAASRNAAPKPARPKGRRRKIAKPAKATTRRSSSRQS